MLPIKTFSNWGGSDARWHEIYSRNSDVTEAMNVAGGVIVRTRLEASAGEYGEGCCAVALAVSMAKLDGMRVAQRWAVEVVKEDPVDEVPSHIRLYQETMLVSNMTMHDDIGRTEWLVKTGGGYRFRYVNADHDMPAPPDEIVRWAAEVNSGRPPTEVEALRREVEFLKGQISEHEGLADYYRSQRDHLLGDLTFEEATADNPWNAFED